MADLLAIKEAVLKGKRQEVPDLIRAALEGGADPHLIINDYMIGAMKEVGAKFEARKIFVPEMMIAARAMQAGVEVIKGALSDTGSADQALGTVVMGTVFGDLHDIGKNLVVMMLESSGYSAINIGENVTPEDFVAKAFEHGADVVGLSSLLTSGDPHVKATVSALKGCELADKVKVICGGAAVTEKFALGECGADGWAPDAVSAVKIIKELLDHN